MSRKLEPRVARRNACRGDPQAAGHEQLAAGQGDRRARQRIGEIIAGKCAITADIDCGCVASSVFLMADG